MHKKFDALTKSGGKTRSTTAALGAIRVDEVEALTHQRLLEVEHHAGEIEEALGVDEDADGAAAAGVVGGFDALAKDKGAVVLAGLGVKADVIAEAGAAAALDADAQPTRVGRDAFLGHRHPDAFECILRDLDGLLRARLLALGGEERHARKRIFGGRGSGLGCGSSGLEESCRHGLLL